MLRSGPTCRSDLSGSSGSSGRDARGSGAASRRLRGRVVSPRDRSRPSAARMPSYERPNETRRPTGGIRARQTGLRLAGRDRLLERGWWAVVQVELSPSKPMRDRECTNEYARDERNRSLVAATKAAAVSTSLVICATLLSRPSICNFASPFRHFDCGLEAGLSAGATAGEGIGLHSIMLPLRACRFNRRRVQGPLPRLALRELRYEGARNQQYSK